VAKRRKYRTHIRKAWGASYNGIWVSEIRLVYYDKSEAWRLILGKTGYRSRQQAVAHGWRVCRVRITRQQIDES
jgi:hypothetical protein